MAYIAIPRKYRPQKFSDVVGQEFIVETLKNAIKVGRFAHAYIFAGPRGVGKTTTARIVAKALNCESLKEGEPCNECKNCIEITKGAFPDVIEIDAATNRGIDQIRELRESVHYAPSKGKKKVYIIDEFHMLTKEAFNALLKTLEEPPEHVVFILATTEIDRIPPTILSRCQKFIFRHIPKERMTETLREICNQENVTYEEEALNIIATASEGCMRDAESLLEQAIALGGGNLKAEQVSEFLGILTGKELIELLKLGFSGNKETLREKIKELENRGYNPIFVIKQLLEIIEREFLTGKEFSEEEMEAAFELLSKAHREAGIHPFPYSVLLFYLYRLSYFKEIKRLNELLSSGIQLAEKKTNKVRSSVENYIKESVDKGNYVEIIPKNSLSYEILRSRTSELEEIYGKDIRIIEIERKNGKKQPKLSKEEDEKINKLVNLFGAKIINIEPIEEK